MKVKELIELLQSLDPDTPVYLKERESFICGSDEFSYLDYENSYNEVESVEKFKGINYPYGPRRNGKRVEGYIIL